MRVVITGASGFLGSALVRRLRAQPHALSGTGLPSLTLVDHTGPVAPVMPGEHWHVGGIAHPEFLQTLCDDPPAYVFHLASVPGALAERSPALGVQANLVDTIALLECLARTVRERGTHPPRLVFASSVAVYGAVGPHPVTEHQTPDPQLSYGTHKWASELLLADYSRRGELDACSVRLPGVVARPPAESGHGSAFMSQIFHALHTGQRYVCPVPADATAWWMSLDRCLDNLLHAAQIRSMDMPSSRCWQLPVVQAQVGDVVAAMAQLAGRDVPSHIRYAPDPQIEALFGRLPVLSAPCAEAAGFMHDGSVQTLVARVQHQLQDAQPDVLTRAV